MFKPGERIALAALDRPARPAEWLAVVSGLHDQAGFWWLDSALADGRLGRFSFAGADPYLWLRARGRRVEIDVLRPVRPGLDAGVHVIDADPFDSARSLLPRADSLVYSTRTAIGAGNRCWHEVDGLSAGLELPFVGGAVGYFGYELAALTLPRVSCANPDELGLPDLVLAYVDRILAYDHATEQLWLVALGFGAAGTSTGMTARDAAMRASRGAADRWADRVEALLEAGVRARCAAADRTPKAAAGGGRADPSADAVFRESDAPTLASTVDASGYAKAVDAILEEIAAGYVYQANFSQRLAMAVDADPWTLYAALRRRNPAPFGAFLALPPSSAPPGCETGPFGGARSAILSSSPERFLRMDAARRVESRPIKGTRPRGDDAVADVRLARELAASEKDRAENLMIVDLVRNDLGRVCTPGTIAVPELMRIEAYASVFQLVSTVTGELATGRDGLDLVRANFPPGSMTGAPKLAAVELLEALESVRRGVYAGALGYLDLRGGLDLSVVIRTLVWQEGRVHLHVGGGIVADSSAQAEYLESLDKARAPLSAIAEVSPESASGASRR
ncbi:MAG: anthranilate synthase component I family protein [Myxococcota bacterium]